MKETYNCLLAVIFFVFCTESSTAQDTIVQDLKQYYLCEGGFVSKKDSLKSEFGKNKTIPETIELAALAALSYYPELRDIKIKFYFVDGLKAVMRSIPCPKSMLRKKENRTYFIKIRKGSTMKMSFNELVGILGHELAHIVQVHKNSSGYILGIGIDWKLSKRKRSLFEHEADLITIQKGLGYALYERRSIALKNSKSTGQEQYIRLIYMEPKEIEQQILVLEY